jgi:hypothetical protein
VREAHRAVEPFGARTQHILFFLEGQWPDEPVIGSELFGGKLSVLVGGPTSELFGWYLCMVVGVPVP